MELGQEEGFASEEEGWGRASRAKVREECFIFRLLKFRHEIYDNFI
jgi:hypothetical protein